MDLTAATTQEMVREIVKRRRAGSSGKVDVIFSVMQLLDSLSDTGDFEVANNITDSVTFANLVREALQDDLRQHDPENVRANVTEISQWSALG